MGEARSTPQSRKDLEEQILERTAWLDVVYMAKQVRLLYLVWRVVNVPQVGAVDEEREALGQSGVRLCALLLNLRPGLRIRSLAISAMVLGLPRLSQYFAAFFCSFFSGSRASGN